MLFHVPGQNTFEPLDEHCNPGNLQQERKAYQKNSHGKLIKQNHCEALTSGVHSLSAALHLTYQVHSFDNIPWSPNRRMDRFDRNYVLRRLVLRGHSARTPAARWLSVAGVLG